MYFGRPLTDKELNAIFSAVNTSKTGAINYSEFLVACADKDSLLNNERLTAAFKMFDKDGDGMITKNEIKNLFA
jgi:calcium-dependent protein kinase